jgi:4-amino-4-deoxy-L-arabinose transferase-like glycosyltransferase
VQTLVQGTFLVLLGGFLFFHRLADRDLWSSHEARAAQNAQSVLAGRDWALPRLFDGRVEMQKPPLYYWLVALAARLRGLPVDAWSVRLPAALAALAGLLVVYAFAWGQGRPSAGLVAAAVLATAQHYTWLARVGRIDMPLTFAVTAALCAYFQASLPSDDRRRWHWFLLMYLAAALGVMLKGPIAVALVAVVVVGHALVGAWRRALPGETAARAASAGWRALGGSLLWGLPLLLALTLPWYLWANARTDGEFFRVFLWYHNVERGLGGAEALEARPWWFYGPQFAFDFLPWSPLLAGAVWLLYRRPQWRRDPLLVVGLAWWVAMGLLLSCLRFKRADYLLPAFPGAALVLGCLAERWCQQRRQLGLSLARPMLAAALVVSAVCLAWWIFLDHLLPRLEPAREQRRFAAAVRRVVPPPKYVLFFRAESHALAFHLGPPLNTFVEWENLNTWAGRPGPNYIIMPAHCAAEWPRHLTAGRLEEVLRGPAPADGRQPLVLMRTCPHPLQP